jgi:hypothetical protein
MQLCPHQFKPDSDSAARDAFGGFAGKYRAVGSYGKPALSENNGLS